MSDKILGQCATLVGSVAIPKKLLAVPTPSEEDSGKFIKAASNGELEWDDIKTPEQVQSNLNQDDPSALDYVKGRTHWIEPVEDVILSETTFEATYADDRYESMYWSVDTIIPDLIRGVTYKVVFDGVAYECIAVDDGYGGEALGNFGLIEEGENTGEPFFIYEEENGLHYSIGVQNKNSHTVSIICLEKFHCLDKNFLPADISVKWDNVTEKPGGYDTLNTYAKLYETDVSLNTADHCMLFNVDKNLLVVGNTYYPVIDGVERDPVVAKIYEGQYATYTVIGNPSLHNLTHENSGEDYLLEVSESQSYSSLYVKDGYDNNVKKFELYGTGYTPVPFPDKYVPNTIARVEDIPAACGITRIETAINDQPKINLRDLESGTYIIYGYFEPYPNSNISISSDNSLISVCKKDEGSHVICLDPLNAKMVFFEILVNESDEAGFTYTRTNIPMLDVYEMLNSKSLEITESSTDEQIPTAKAVYDLFNSTVNEVLSALPTWEGDSY